MNSTSKEAYTGRVAYERVNECKEVKNSYKSGELAVVSRSAFSARGDARNIVGRVRVFRKRQAVFWVSNVVQGRECDVINPVVP
jgi:hypothetical protein